MADKYVFLDRDGVINRDGSEITEHGYIIHWEDFEFLPGVIDAMVKLYQQGFKCVIISNQQCVGKNICSEEDINELSRHISEEIKSSGGEITKFYYCFHREEDDCGCRKPAPGLFEQAKKGLGIEDITGFFYVGDTERDVQAGRAAGVKTILVLSGNTKKGEAENWSHKPEHVCENLLEAVDVIIGENRRQKEPRALSF